MLLLRIYLFADRLRVMRSRALLVLRRLVSRSCPICLGDPEPGVTIETVVRGSRNVDRVVDGYRGMLRIGRPVRFGPPPKRRQ